MIHSALISACKFRTNIRPVRHAYLVSARSSHQLERAMSFCCTQWGGISNLIVPVGSSLRIPPLYEHLLTLVEPDVVVSYLPADSEGGRLRHDKLQARLSALWPHSDVALHTAAYEKDDMTAHPLSVLADDDVAAHQFLDRRFQGPPSDRMPLLAMFGQVYPGQEDDYARLLQYGRLPVGLDSLDLWAQEMRAQPFSSPINLTGYGVHAYKVEGSSLGSDAFFELVVGDSIADLCLFWNLRAVRESTRFSGEQTRRLLLLPSRVLRDPEALRRFADALRGAPSPGATSNLDLAVYRASRQAAEAWAAAASQSPEFSRMRDEVRVTWSFGRDSSSSEPADEHRPLTYAHLYVDLPERFWEGVHYEIPRRIPLSIGENEVRIEPPSSYRKRSNGLLMLDLESEAWQRYPRRVEVARAIHANARFTRYGVSFLSDVSLKPSEFRFYLPSEWETLVAVFQRAGLVIRESDKTRYLEAVVQVLGGFENADVLASRPTLLLLEALAVPPTARLAQRIVRELGLTPERQEEVASALKGSEMVVELSAGSKSLQQLRDGLLAEHKRGLLTLLARLSETGIVRRCFRLPCADCGLTTWHPMGTVDEVINCPGCGGSFPLPVEMPPGSEIQLHYVLNSLVNRAWDQGVIPALLAMSHVAAQHSGACCKTAGLELLRAGDLVGDLDFVMFAEGRLLAGEAKTGSILEKKDFEGAELAADVGVAEFSFCTTSTFDQEAAEGIETLRQRLREQGRDMVVSVLESEHLLDGASSGSDNDSPRRS